MARKYVMTKYYFDIPYDEFRQDCIDGEDTFFTYKGIDYVIGGCKSKGYYLADPLDETFNPNNPVLLSERYPSILAVVEANVLPDGKSIKDAYEEVELFEAAFK